MLLRKPPDLFEPSRPLRRFFLGRSKCQKAHKHQHMCGLGAGRQTMTFHSLYFWVAQMRRLKQCDARFDTHQSVMLFDERSFSELSPASQKRKILVQRQSGRDSSLPIVPHLPPAKECGEAKFEKRTLQEAIIDLRSCLTPWSDWRIRMVSGRLLSNALKNFKLSWSAT